MAGMISVESAAKQLGFDPMTLRCLMRDKQINVGFYYKREGCRRGKYYVYQKLVDQAKRELGIEGYDNVEEDNVD